MELADKFREGNPWPVRDGQRVLFILDSRNGFERDLLRQWIHHHRASGSEEFERWLTEIDRFIASKGRPE